MLKGTFSKYNKLVIRRGGGVLGSKVDNRTRRRNTVKGFGKALVSSLPPKLSQSSSKRSVSSQLE